MQRRVGHRGDPQPQPHSKIVEPPVWRGFGLSAAIAAVGIAVLWSGSIPAAIEAGSRRPTMGTYDYYNYFLPRFEFGNEEMAAGRLPIWNRFEFGGLPFLATAQPAPLYPPKILAFAMLDAGQAMRAFLIAHYALLAAGFLVFARKLGITGFGALAGTVYWTFTTTILLSNYHPNRIACMVWVPVIFLLADRVAKSWRGPPIAAFSVAIALQLFAGYPALTLSLAPLLGVHSIAMYWTGHWQQPPWKSLPRIATGFVLGACIAGYQLVPLAEVASISQRAAEAAAAAPPFLMSIGLLINDRGLGGWYFIFMSFPGLAGFWIAAVAHRESSPALSGLLICLFFAFGGWLLVRFIPGFSLIRHGLVWLFLMQFYLAWLVGIGAKSFQAIDDAEKKPWWTQRWTQGCLAFCGLAWAGLCAVNFGPELERGQSDTAGPGAALSSVLYGGDVANGLGLIGGLMLAAAVFTTASSRRKWIGFAGVCVVMFGQLAAYPFGGATGRFGYPPAPFRVRALAERASVTPAGRSVSEIDRTHGTNFSQRVPLMLGTLGSFAPERFVALQNRLISRIGGQVKWRPIWRAGGLLDAMNVDLLVGPASRADEFRSRGLSPLGPAESRRMLFRNDDRIGEAWVTYGTRAVKSPEAALEYLLSADFDPRLEVIVEAPLTNRYRKQALQPSTPAQVHRASPTQVDVEVETSEAGILVLADAWYPGWEASVDDRPVEILQVNYVLRGVELLAGRHSIRFEYRPASFRYGLAVSCVGILAALALCLFRTAHGRTS